MKVVALCALTAVSCSAPSPPAAPPEAAPETTASTPTPAMPLPPSDTPAPGSFEDDVAFLKKHGDVILLEAPSGGRVALSAAYQGRVMTSAVSPGGRSLGWVHRKFIQEAKAGTPFDNYGGEDRFWLGPEGGQFGLYFPPGAAFDFAKWQTPPALQEGAWTVKDRSPSRVVFTRSMKVKNWTGTEFELDVERTVRLLDAKEVEARVGGAPATSLKWVAFETENKITNTGRTAWTKEKGLLSVWILAMYPPAPDAFVAIPFDTAAKGSIVNDRYFGKVPADRLQVNDKEGWLLFKCDGKQRSKIGVGPARAKQVLGSFSASTELLTIVHYDKPASSTGYVNSMWEKQKEPYGGDVVNSYNDGPVAPDKPPLGGFYEIETSGPATALAPGASFTHTHRTFHFVGDRAGLDAIATRVLGVSATRMAEGVH